MTFGTTADLPCGEKENVEGRFWTNERTLFPELTGLRKKRSLVRNRGDDQS